MDVRFVSDEGIQQYPVGELERLLARAYRDHIFPVNPAVTAEAAQRETRAVLGRIEGGRLHAGSPSALSMRSSRPWRKARRRS